MTRHPLLVHAHLDDEDTATGATMALHARSGAAVSLVRCTRGDRGLHGWEDDLFAGVRS